MRGSPEKARARDCAPSPTTGNDDHERREEAYHTPRGCGEFTSIGAVLEDILVGDAATTCARCAQLELDLGAERARANELLRQLAAAAPICTSCAALAGELACALRNLAESHAREEALLASLREWNLAAASALDGLPDGAR